MVALALSNETVRNFLKFGVQVMNLFDEKFIQGESYDMQVDYVEAEDMFVKSYCDSCLLLSVRCFEKRTPKELSELGNFTASICLTEKPFVYIDYTNIPKYAQRKGIGTVITQKLVDFIRSSDEMDKKIMIADRSLTVGKKTVWSIIFDKFPDINVEVY